MRCRPSITPLTTTSTRWRASGRGPEKQLEEPLAALVAWLATKGQLPVITDLRWPLVEAYARAAGLSRPESEALSDAVVDFARWLIYAGLVSDHPCMTQP